MSSGKAACEATGAGRSLLVIDGSGLGASGSATGRAAGWTGAALMSGKAAGKGLASGNGAR